jgi:hypothetical protein
MRTDRVRVERNRPRAPEVAAEAGMSGVGSLSSNGRGRCWLGEPILLVRAIV